MPADRIALGYNAVDNAFLRATGPTLARRAPTDAEGCPRRPYFLSVCRFVPEKNLVRLIEAFARYRDAAGPTGAWDLVLCGDGPEAGEVERAVARERVTPARSTGPGSSRPRRCRRWYAHAAAFVLPSLMEPWGLVVNEAAARAAAAGLGPGRLRGDARARTARDDRLRGSIRSTSRRWPQALAGWP